MPPPAGRWARTTSWLRWFPTSSARGTRTTRRAATSGTTASSRSATPKSGYKVLAESNQAAAAVECADGPVEPKALGFELHQVDAGVKLDWEACTSGDFVAYKVVRSQVNENPTFPLNDGTQLVAVFENHEVTTFTDTDLAAGQTWIYRVYSMAKNGDGGWVVLGLTQAKTITVA